MTSIDNHEARHLHAEATRLRSSLERLDIFVKGWKPFLGNIKSGQDGIESNAQQCTLPARVKDDLKDVTEVGRMMRRLFRLSTRERTLSEMSFRKGSEAYSEAIRPFVIGSWNVSSRWELERLELVKGTPVKNYWSSWPGYQPQRTTDDPERVTCITRRFTLCIYAD